MRCILVLFLCFAQMLTLFSDENKNRSPILVEPSASIDFGTYQANEQKCQVFTITNTGKNELIFGKVRPTCECSVAELTRSKLKPGDNAELTACIKAESISGNYSKIIYIETNLKAEPFLKLVLNGNSQPLVKVEPSNYIYMGAIKAGEKHIYKFKLTTSNAETQLSLEEPKNENYYELHLEKEEKKWTLTVSVVPNKSGQPLKIEFPVIVSKPVGWKPINFKLTGKSVNQE